MQVTQQEYQILIEAKAALSTAAKWLDNNPNGMQAKVAIEFIIKQNEKISTEWESRIGVSNGQN